MKKLLVVIGLITIMTILSACGTNETPEELETRLDNKDVLTYLSYISTSFFNPVVEEDANVNYGMVRLNLMNHILLDKPDKLQPDIELDIETATLYVDKLKSFIENGTDAFGSISELDSDRTEYEFMIQVNFENENYILYYNVDEVTNEISGVFVNDDIEYEIVAENSYLKTKDIDDLSEEEKRTLILMVKQDNDMIIVEYEEKIEDNETKETFNVVSYVGGDVHEFGIEIKTEENEYKLTVFEDGNEYIFKIDEEEDEDFNYMMDYIVNGVRGKVRIMVKENDLGEVTYFYRVQERNIKIDIEVEDPDVGGTITIIE